MAAISGAPKCYTQSKRQVRVQGGRAGGGGGGDKIRTPLVVSVLRHRQNLRWTPFIVRSIMRAGKR